MGVAGGIAENRASGVGWKRTLSDATVDAFLGGASLAAGMAAGAAIGSLFPGVGTIADAVVGLGISIAVTSIKRNGKSFSDVTKEKAYGLF